MHVDTGSKAAGANQQPGREELRDNIQPFSAASQTSCQCLPLVKPSPGSSGKRKSGGTSLVVQ